MGGHLLSRYRDTVLSREIFDLLSRIFSRSMDRNRIANYFCVEIKILFHCRNAVCSTIPSHLHLGSVKTLQFEYVVQWSLVKSIVDIAQLGYRLAFLGDLCLSLIHI